ncbi:hypothetical protein BC937DRAFT_88528 [Endogone sp. FLAS-F59071]|nr:hypothetical protein BC937DRAFT_88528 [Endogone sp. FLAS-F59071]|eukprot:RUS18629.1 hypothetical protein BC937DRAFT_88528 [Endogone sp. FLAS-F59071]
MRSNGVGTRAVGRHVKLKGRRRIERIRRREIQEEDKTREDKTIKREGVEVLPKCDPAFLLWEIDSSRAKRRCRENQWAERDHETGEVRSNNLTITSMCVSISLSYNSLEELANSRMTSADLGYDDEK